jgi:hypothetical protein
MDANDFEQIKEYLRDNLSIHVARPTNRNDRFQMILRLEGKEISSTPWIFPRDYLTSYLNKN